MALASAAAGYALTSLVSRPVFVGCYAASSTTAPAYVIESTGGPAAAACRPLWRHGPISTSGGPPLFACVLSSGAVGVFPGREGSPCATLGLAVPAASGAAPPLAFRLRLALGADEARSRGCLPPGDAYRDATGTLARAGARGWHVILDRTSSKQRPCSGFAIDPVAKRVYVVPQPRT